MTISIILPVPHPRGSLDFVAASELAQTLLHEAGITVGVFGLDVSFNEDHRYDRPEEERFSDHACVHLYGLIPANGATAAKADLKRLIPATEAVPATGSYQALGRKARRPSLMR